MIVVRAAKHLTGGATLQVHCAPAAVGQPGNRGRQASGRQAGTRAGEAGRRGDSVGTYICADLACSLLIRITPPALEMQPTPDEVVASRAAGLEARVRAFTGKVLQAA